ncbi:Clavaminate synthase-like protein [Meredithblackwellia eburnea MCA 4105]
MSNLENKILHQRNSNPLQLKPLGNLLWRPAQRFTRIGGLGSLAVLPDELLLSHVFASFEAEDLFRAQGVSRAFYGWTRVEGIWKGLYISKTQGRLLDWYGSWRSSYVCTFFRPSSILDSTPLPTDHITTPTHHSDVLFQPCLCASFDPCSVFRSPTFVPSISRIDGRGLKPDDLPRNPIILTHLMEDWPAFAPSTSPEVMRNWTLPLLSSRYPTTLFRAEATLTTLPSYEGYHNQCEFDESPLYLFESGFVGKTAREGGSGMGEDYTVPECFQEDLFQVMGNGRPDYRWLIVGPKRSGSTWHQDPNGTSAWNAVTTGSKAWIMFHPDVTPPGVFVSEDQGEVEAPLSLAEWFNTYYKGAKSTYGANAKDSSKRGKMVEGICEAGEIFYVPSGWWHIVVNLTPAVAVTQNYVSNRELPAVLRFMRDRPEQVSGFKLAKGPVDTNAAEGDAGGLGECDECVPDVFEKFVESLRRDKRDIMEDEKVKIIVEGKNKGSSNGVEVKRGKDLSLWERVKEERETSGGFSFGFGFEDGDELENVED